MSKKHESKKSINWDGTFVNFALTLCVFLAATALCAFIHQHNSGGSISASMIFILAVLLVARITKGYVWGILFSFAGVIVVNYIFTYPFWELNFSLNGYP